jgi:predicted transcriptional regulator
MTVRVEIDLEEDQKAQLDELATGRGGAAADLIVEAVRNYLRDADAYRKFVQVGLDDVAAGRVTDLAEVEAHFARKADDRGMGGN